MIADTTPQTIPAEIGALGQIDAWLAAFAGAHALPADMQAELRVCLHELAGNVIMHGLPRGAAHRITLRGHMDGANVVIEFADSAAPFNPLLRQTGPAAGRIEDVPIGGLGLHLVRSFTDAVSYAHDGAWNRLTLMRGPR